MSIFSKWFGSKDKEEQKEEIAEEEVCFRDAEQNEVLPDPKNLPEALRYVVDKWGYGYLQNRSLLNILNDFQVLKDLPAAKHIIQNISIRSTFTNSRKASNDFISICIFLFNINFFFI